MGISLKRLLALHPFLLLKGIDAVVHLSANKPYLQVAWMTVH
jgi:hypothetical protein